MIFDFAAVGIGAALGAWLRWGFSAWLNPRAPLFPAGTLVANLGYDKRVMPKPVFLGDTLRATSEVVELRPSKSRPGQGIVTWKHEMINQRDEIVCECLRSALMLPNPKV